MRHAPSPPEAPPSWVLPLLGAGLPCLCTQGMDGQAAQGSSLMTGMPLRLMQVPGHVCRIRIPINKQCVTVQVHSSAGEAILSKVGVVDGSLIWPHSPCPSSSSHVHVLCHVALQLLLSKGRLETPSPCIWIGLALAKRMRQKGGRAIEF